MTAGNGDCSLFIFDKKVEQPPLRVIRSYFAYFLFKYGYLANLFIYYIEKKYYNN